MKCVKIRTFHSRLIDVDNDVVDVEICEGREGGGESKELMERCPRRCSPDSVDARLPSLIRKKSYLRKYNFKILPNICCYMSKEKTETVAVCVCVCVCVCKCVHECACA